MQRQSETARSTTSGQRPRPSSQEGELIISATYNVGAMAVDGKYGVGRAAGVLGVYHEIAVASSVCRKLGVAVSLLFFKRGM